MDDLARRSEPSRPSPWRSSWSVVYIGTLGPIGIYSDGSIACQVCENPEDRSCPHAVTVTGSQRLKAVDDRLNDLLKRGAISGSQAQDQFSAAKYLIAKDMGEEGEVVEDDTQMSAPDKEGQVTDVKQINQSTYAIRVFNPQSLRTMEVVLERRPVAGGIVTARSCIWITPSKPRCGQFQRTSTCDHVGLAVTYADQQNLFTPSASPLSGIDTSNVQINGAYGVYGSPFSPRMATSYSYDWNIGRGYLDQPQPIPRLDPPPFVPRVDEPDLGFEAYRRSLLDGLSREDWSQSQVNRAIANAERLGTEERERISKRQQEAARKERERLKKEEAARLEREEQERIERERVIQMRAREIAETLGRGAKTLDTDTLHVDDVVVPMRTGRSL